MGMASLVEETLNVQILESYMVIPATSILPHEYSLNLATGLDIQVEGDDAWWATAI